MNDRVTQLRQSSLDARPTVTTERAELMTEFYKSAPMASVPVTRALSFKHLMENKTIVINDGELIVGERGIAPKSTPTYPELCCHSVQDLEIMRSRRKTPYAVDDESIQLYKDKIIPFWQGRSMRDLMFAEMTPDWHAAYDAGIYTEFMEQRAPGHTVADDKIYRKGFLDFKNDIQAALDALDYFNDPDAYNKQEQLKAMSICCDAIIRYGERHAEKAKELAAVENDPARKAELEKIAEVCSWVPANAPRNFHEALQAYWFVHLGVITELNTWDSFNPGRLDQHLQPFYKKGIDDGTLTAEQAKELLQCFWVKFNNQPAPPKVGVTAAESGTYTDFANINSGGLKVDGSDGVNDVTYLVLDVIDEMRLLQPSSNIQLSKKNPDRFLKRAARIIRKGWGQPSIFNTDTVIEEMLRQGKSIEDARCGGNSGCVETGAFGKEAYILAGYMNLPKILEIALNNGVDPRTGIQLGPQTGDVSKFTTYEEVFEAYKEQLKFFVDVKVRGSNVIERLYAQYMPSPFLSIIIEDCIAKGKDYNDAGARYNTTYIQGVGLGSITDSLASIKYNVFDEKKLTIGEMLDILAGNFEGNEETRQMFFNKTPKFGNDDDYADDIMRSVFETYYDEVNGRPNTRGGYYRINMLPTTCHVYFGSVTGADAGGRFAWEPLSEGISPVQGADRNGPTSVIKSAAKMDHVRTGGTLLNVKFTPQVLEGEAGIDQLAHLVRSYFKLGGHHIQFNVVTADILRKAKADPEKYRDLIVRVAGYSDYFCDISDKLQEEIIARTEHKTF